VSLRALPTPYSSRPQLSQASPGTALTFNFFSYNADQIAKVEIYASYLPATTVPAPLASTATYANYVASNTPAGISGVIPEVPGSGDLPVTVLYARYDALIKGGTAPNTFTPMPRVLLKTLAGSEAVGNYSFTLTELATATGATIATPVSTNIANQSSFILVFEVTDVNGFVYNYLNSGPSITGGPATGRVLDKTYTLSNPTKAYKWIMNGDEGSPFLPGTVIRVGP
jgi:hypothetical protein